MQDILTLCKENDEIYIYGAGRISNILYLFLQNHFVSERVLGFLVTKRNNNPLSKYGKKVLEYKEVKSIAPQTLVIISVLGKAADEIYAFLTKEGFKNLLVIDAISLVDQFYREISYEPIKTDKIIFQNMNGMGFGGNPKYLALELIRQMQEKEKRYDLVWAVDTNTYLFPDEIRTVELGSLEYYRELATSRVWVDNTRKGCDVRKREGQFYLQTWHGAAPFKKVEADVEDKLPSYYIDSAKYDSKMADLFLSGSSFYSELYRKSFWYSGPIMKVGLPRQDVFWQLDETKKRIKKELSIDEGALVLYAPTFRARFVNDCYDLEINAVKSALQRKFQTPFSVLVSKHPNNINVHYLFEGRENYIDVSGFDDFEAILAAADILITDYSGCAYDFSFSKRPIFLYQPDYKEYMDDRGFYIPIQELPYPRAESNEELVEKITEFDYEEYKTRLESFMLSMGNYDSGEASAKVASWLIHNVL